MVRRGEWLKRCFPDLDEEDVEWEDKSGSEEDEDEEDEEEGEEGEEEGGEEGEEDAEMVSSSTRWFLTSRRVELILLGLWCTQDDGETAS